MGSTRVRRFRMLATPDERRESEKRQNGTSHECPDKVEPAKHVFAFRSRPRRHNNYINIPVSLSVGKATLLGSLRRLFINERSGLSFPLALHSKLVYKTNRNALILQATSLPRCISIFGTGLSPRQVKHLFHLAKRERHPLMHYS